MTATPTCRPHPDPALDAGPLRVLVVQMGARRGYELARMLDRRGALAALQTSAAWADGHTPEWMFDMLGPRLRSAAQRRTVRGIAPPSVRTTPVPEIMGTALKLLRVETERRHRIEDWFLGWKARRNGLSGANVVLNTTGNGGAQFLSWAKARGARIVTDVVITPCVYEILSEEMSRWPGWEAAADVRKAIAIYRRHMEAIISISDLLLCPSDTVISGLATIRGFQSHKAVKMPYALGNTVRARGTPIPKRVFFAGEAGLRKGLPYLASAARELKHRDPTYEFRIAGKVSDQTRARPECQALTFLGHIGPDQMRNEFRSADLFCLPSLAEGMASAALEAMAHGVPCVVTRAAGAPVQDGTEGRIVRERDSSHIADAISAIANDRAMREQMSAAALRRAGQHTLDAVADRLHSLLLQTLQREV